MKSTGIVRKVDELGRIVLPKELRRTLSLETGDGVEIFVDGEKIVLRKYTPGCTLCGSVDEPVAVTVGDKQICRACATVIRS